eukprot:768620-Hanusia_phi.AAC.4
MGPSFVAHCRQKAAEELEAEFREDNVINSEDTEVKGFRLQAEGLWRKKFGNFLKYIPGVGSREEAKSPVVEDQDGEEECGTPPVGTTRTLRRLWKLMTDINTDLMLRDSLASSKPAVLQGVEQDMYFLATVSPWFLASRCVNSVPRLYRFEEEAKKSLATFHNALDFVFRVHVAFAQIVEKQNEKKNQIPELKRKFEVPSNHSLFSSPETLEDFREGVQNASHLGRVLPSRCHHAGSNLLICYSFLDSASVSGRIDHLAWPSFICAFGAATKIQPLQYDVSFLESALSKEFEPAERRKVQAKSRRPQVWWKTW